MKPFQTEILWARLAAGVDEAAVGLMRTAFAGIVRDSKDFACGLFDRDGRLLAQDTYGTPGLSGTLPGALRFMLARYPVENLGPGDTLITNDPWGGTGHLHDTTLLTPIFHLGEIAGYAISCAHKIDIGGRGMTTESRDVHEEGLWLPVLRLMNNGQPNTDVWDIIRANVRGPDMVLGDLRAQIAANQISERHLRAVLDEVGAAGIAELGGSVTARTEAGTRTAIDGLPDGRFSAHMELDSRPGRFGKLTPVRLEVAIEIHGDSIVVDYEGTSPQVGAAVNSPFNGLTLSYTLMALKCVLDPLVPINSGFMRPISVRAPDGCILNPTYPVSVRSRSQVAHFIPELVFAALEQVVPERVIAPSGTVPAWNQQIDGTWANGRAFAQYLPIRGGLGARPDRDGLSCISFPTNVSTLPIESLESDSPVIVEHKELVCDSGGAGQFRGGCGQEVALRVLASDAISGPLHIGTTGGRFDYTIPGFGGGGDAATGAIEFNGESIRTGAVRELAPGDSIVFRTPGGGGFYPPTWRSPEKVAEDVAAGYVSAAKATDVYAVVLDPSGQVDREATALLRQRATADVREEP